jgi:lysophospholipase L1-like esterase
VQEKIISPESPAQLLARSLFGFALLAFIPAVMTLIALLLTPAAADAGFANIRTLIMIIFGLLAVAIFALCVWAFRTAPQKLLAFAQKITFIFGNKIIAFVLVIILIELNFFAGLALLNVAPLYVDPARFLLACWSLLLAGILLTIHFQAVQISLEKTRGLWIATGLTIAGILFFGSLYWLTAQIVRITGIDERLRGGLDYRELIFIDDGNAPTSQAFWSEQSRTRIRWLPYSYWTVAPFAGEYINVNENGLRDTPQYSEDAQKIYMFGGSTVWGEGARDAYTIPGHLARLFRDSGDAQIVMNYGQTGYVSTQDVILFQMQLAQNNVPDIAIFYQGFNDILAAYYQQYAGVTLQEDMRLNDSEAGRLLRSGQPVLRLPNFALADIDLTLAAAQPTSAQAIVDRWLANMRLISILAEGYGVKVLFVWQPSILYKDALSDAEQGIVDRMERDQPGLTTLYQEVDSLVRQQVIDKQLKNVVLLSDLFQSETRYIFHDLVHITEEGNQSVAEAILPILETLLK